MQRETTCPTCGGPCTVENTGPHWTTMRHPTLGTDVQIASGKLEYRTTADPARVARLSDAVLDQIRAIAADWGNTLDEVAEGAIIEGIRAWEEQDKRNREAGVRVDRVHFKLGPADAS